MFYQLYVYSLKSYFRNRSTLFWSFGFVLMWIFIYAYGFPYPGKDQLEFSESSYASFIILFGVSSAMVSTAFNTISVNMAMPFLVRFTNVKEQNMVTANILSSATFAAITAVFALIFSTLIFEIRFGSFNVNNLILLFLNSISVSLLFVSLGILISNLLCLFSQVNAAKFLGFMPMLMVFVLVLGLQIFRSPSSQLIYYSPFNTQYTLFMFSIIGPKFLNQYNFSINIPYLYLSLAIWLLLLCSAAILLEKIYVNSQRRGKFNLEEIYS